MTLQLHNEPDKGIFSESVKDFEAISLQTFRFQYENNTLYRQYCNAINIDPAAVNSLSKIPFLPIQYFKTKEITSTAFSPEAIFESSGTTGSINSKHYVKDLALYETSFFSCFGMFYGKPTNFCILALLPSYLERKNASLVYMADKLIEASGHPASGFYLNDLERLHDTLMENEKNHQPTLLLGVTYALLDFAEKYDLSLTHTIVMETGGMKGRRKEMTRDSVHELLIQRLGITDVHSEYGMTELLSQSYSSGKGIFRSPPWMKVLLRAEDDPLHTLDNHMSNAPFQTGAVNVIDLANKYSCSFIATDDLGKRYADGSFEIVGRLENSDIRGCGLMLL